MVPRKERDSGCCAVPPQTSGRVDDRLIHPAGGNALQNAGSYYHAAGVGRVVDNVGR